MKTLLGQWKCCDLYAKLSNLGDIIQQKKCQCLGVIPGDCHHHHHYYHQPFRKRLTLSVGKILLVNLHRLPTSNAFITIQPNQLPTVNLFARIQRNVTLPSTATNSSDSNFENPLPTLALVLFFGVAVFLLFLCIASMIAAYIWQRKHGTPKLQGTLRRRSSSSLSGFWAGVKSKSTSHGQSYREELPRPRRRSPRKRGKKGSASSDERPTSPGPTHYNIHDSIEHVSAKSPRRSPPPLSRGPGSAKPSSSVPSYSRPSMSTAQVSSSTVKGSKCSNKSCPPKLK